MMVTRWTDRHKNTAIKLRFLVLPNLLKTKHMETAIELEPKNSDGDGGDLDERFLIKNTVLKLRLCFCLLA